MGEYAQRERIHKIHKSKVNHGSAYESTIGISLVQYQRTDNIPLGVRLILSSLSPENAKDTGQVGFCCARGPRMFALNLEDEVTDNS